MNLLTHMSDYRQLILLQGTISIVVINQPTTNPLKYPVWGRMKTTVNPLLKTDKGIIGERPSAPLINRHTRDMSLEPKNERGKEFI